MAAAVVCRNDACAVARASQKPWRLARGRSVCVELVFGQRRRIGSARSLRVVVKVCRVAGTSPFEMALTWGTDRNGVNAHKIRVKMTVKMRGEVSCFAPLCALCGGREIDR